MAERGELWERDADEEDCCVLMLGSDEEVVEERLEGAESYDVVGAGRGVKEKLSTRDFGYCTTCSFDLGQVLLVR